MIRPLKESTGSANFNLEEVLNVMGWSDSGIVTDSILYCGQIKVFGDWIVYVDATQTDYIEIWEYGCTVPELEYIYEYKSDPLEFGYYPKGIRTNKTTLSFDYKGSHKIVPVRVSSELSNVEALQFILTNYYN